MATPVANFTYTIDGLEVTFTDQSSDVDGPITAWSWNFGDGGTSTSEDPVHTYSDAGIYGVALQVTQGAETN
ncbi:PKD domain-containing protein, partial [Candidatus Dependentiae bacterium]|nr:PKD domain-containing protein [Candidatus Dependentiae bacterium]